VTAKSVAHLNADHFGLKVLPVELPMARFPLGVLTIKNRTLTPVVDLFLESAPADAKSMS